MTAKESEAAEPGAAAQDAAVHHARSFKLRFASQREPGRSYVSLVKPLSLPATVSDKFYSRAPQRAGGGGEAAAAEQRALARIRDMFQRGPREALPEPLTESHVYGWWSKRAAGGAEVRGDVRFDHRIRDSAWLKGRLLVLAADQQQQRT